MTELYKRDIRIEAKQGNKGGHFVSITDASTGAIIPGIFRTVVRLDANAISEAEITYYETNEDGSVSVGPDNQPIVHTALTSQFSIDITAMERIATTIGGHDCHIETSNVPGKSYGLLVMEDKNGHEVTFWPDEALELLAWLQQERPALEQLATTHNAKLRRVVARAEKDLSEE